MTQLHDQIYSSLAAAADPETKAKLARLIPGAKALGVTVPQLRELVDAFRRQHSALTLDQACGLMDELCHGRVREEILFGAFLLGHFGKKTAAIPWPRLEPWIGALDNWETCDQLASNVSGAVVAADLGLVERLVELTGSANPWQRRFALATASELNHKGRSHPRETLRVCQPLLADPEPAVRKAVGWALKEASKKAEDEVFDFLLAHRAQMPASILREASEKLSPAHKQQLM
ncbi:MAG: DNA alkylation repair protein [Chloroflexi bacterium]|nr:DNA alkylation repair protein [Chloroflexota bacterium]MCI0575580.1 DNA alkylation repair protein [Chloroflexota bacterium]MCI0648269.1 DNA alkylation repair protein [Chloroflexota bacterium]MCI0728461.1 DNA alkylation repair protein [Chloroflexota bacterium]